MGGEVIAFISLGVVLLFTMASGTSLGRKRSRKAWRAAAEKLGLSTVEGRARTSDRLFGTLEGLEVEAQWFSSPGAGGLLQVSGLDLPHGFEIARWNAGSKFMFQSVSETTGDAAFDEVVRIRELPDSVRARLDASVRSQLLLLVGEHGLSMKDNKARIAGIDAKLSDESWIIEQLEGMVALAHTMSDEVPDVTGALARLVLDDPEVGVRRACLARLTERKEDLSVRLAILEAYLAAPQHEDGAFCLEALAALPETERRGPYLSIATCDAADPKVRAAAVVGLRPIYDNQTRRAVEALLDCPAPEVRNAALAVLDRAVGGGLALSSAAEGQGEVSLVAEARGALELAETAESEQPHEAEEAEEAT